MTAMPAPSASGAREPAREQARRQRRDRDEEQRLRQEGQAGLERVEPAVLLEEEREEEQLAVEGEVRGAHRPPSRR